VQQLGIQWYDITHVSRYSNSLWIAQHYLLFMSLPGEWRSSDNDVRANEDAVECGLIGPCYNRPSMWFSRRVITYDSRYTV